MHEQWLNSTHIYYVHQADDKPELRHAIPLDGQPPVQIRYFLFKRHIPAPTRDILLIRVTSCCVSW